MNHQNHRTLIGDISEKAQLLNAIKLVIFVTILFTTTQSISSSPRNEIVLTREYKQQVLEWIGYELKETYIFPEVAEKMETFVIQRFKSGAYDGVGSISEFTEILTTDLREVSKDKHLGIRHTPEPAPPDNESEEEKQKRMESMLSRMRAENFAFKKMEHLAGNVGYLRFDAFHDARWAGDTAVAAMNFLSGCDALIIDLRYNNGGNPSMIQLISSYFFDESKHLNSFYIRKGDKTKQFWTPERVDGPRMTETELFILTSNNTFSAAEEFTYNLKNLERATIVGETTGGGAHPTDFHQNDELQIGISLPFGRAVNPITGTNWEGTGIEPHVQTSAESAFDEAYRLALGTLHEKAAVGRKDFLKWLLDYQNTLADPVEMSLKTKQAYVGVYGPRRVRVENGSLFYQRENGPVYELLAMGDDWFCLQGLDSFRIQFDRDTSGIITAIRGHAVGGYNDHTPKTE